MVVRMCIKKDFDMLTPLCIYILYMMAAALCRWCSQLLLS